MRCQFLVLCVTVFRLAELHELDFLELMLPDEPAHIFSIRPRFAAETRRVCGERYWQLGGIERLVAIEICYRNFCGGNEPEIVLLSLKLVSFELRQLPRPVQRI